MKLKSLLPFLVLSLCIFISYFNCLQNEFVWDDEFLIEKNTYLRDIKSIPKIMVSNSTAGFGGVDNFYRPTQNLYYLAIYQMFGYSKVAFHLGNILLHVINSWLLFLFILRFFKDQSLALFTSLLWACHPAHAEAITYISGTADPLGFLFFFLFLLSFPFAKAKIEARKFILPAIFFILTLLSKEAMIVGPGLLTLLVAYLSNQNRWKLKTYYPTLPFWLISFFYLFLRKTLLNFNETFDFYKTPNIYTENWLYRSYTFLATLPEYLKILFYPLNLHMERSFPVFTQITSAPVLTGLFVFSVSLTITLFLFIRLNEKKYIFSWAWYFIAFVPMMGILVPVNSFILEHWLYLPSVSIFLCMSLIVLKTKSLHSLLPTVIIATLVLSLGYLTHERNKDWRTPIEFYSNILQYSKGSARVHNNLAMAYSEKQEWEKAIQHYQKAIATSDIYPQTHYNLARAFIENNNYSKALEHLEKSLKIRPDFRFAIELKAKLLNHLQKIPDTKTK